MKIVYTCAYSDIASGGDSRVAWELARYMAKDKNLEVWMLCAGKRFSISRDSLEPALMVQTVSSADVAEGVNIFTPTPSMTKRIYEILDQLNPDIVHAHNYDPLAFAIQGWALARRRPFIYTGHVSASQIYAFQNIKFGRAIEKVITISLKEYTRIFYDNCSKIICLNTSAKDDFAKFMKKDSNLEIIPNGYVFNETEEEHIKLENCKEYNLIFPGYINENKNQKYLIEMLKYLRTDKPVNLYLAGKYMFPKYEKKILELVEVLPKNRKVHLLGYIEHEKILDMYKQSHYLVSASLIEVQSLTVIESLASGTPVIALRNAATSELIKNNYNGEVLSQNLSPQKFAQVLERYLNKKEKAYEMLSRNSRQSIDFLDYSNVSQAYLKLYNSVCKSSVKTSNSRNILENIGKIFNWDIKYISPSTKKFYHNFAITIVTPIVAAGVGAIGMYKILNRKKK